MKPLLMTRAHIEKYYQVSGAEVDELVDELEPVGQYERRDNPLFARKDIEKALKEKQ